MLALMRNPEQMARLRTELTMSTGAVEEFLRLDSPVNVATTRFTTVPVTITGTAIPEGVPGSFGHSAQCPKFVIGATFSKGAVTDVGTRSDERRGT
jgi:hypothetical protein